MDAAESVCPVSLPAELSDGELLTATRRLVGRSNQLLAALLGHLAEVEARGVHRTRACSSLYTYLIYELRFSEDEAFRRVSAARLVRRFPALLDAIASGELHLTGLLLLGPHLTAENLTEVLARSKHRTKKEIARLVRRLDPLPDVPARIEPLGPALARGGPATPTWSQFVESLCPVRELTAGDRPREWTESAGSAQDSGECSNDRGLPELVAAAPERDGAPASAPCGEWDHSVDVPEAARELPAPARLEPERYRVQFTAGDEYVKLVEKAQALLSHSAERVPLDELHLRAMRAFVADLERKKRAATKRPAAGAARATRNPAEQNRRAARELPVEPNVIAEVGKATPQQPRQRGRRVPAAVRRAVLERDQGRCAYFDPSGQRCRETSRLELHHLKPFAKGGEQTVANLALRCSAHNALAAEQDFGWEFTQRRRDGNRHESHRNQGER
jgi:5-methylcytosine-specific restriction endonuclease McrA